MRVWATRIGLCVGLFAVIALICAALITRARHLQEADSLSDEQKIARTLQIIRTSNVTDRKVLRVLFYGQSITRSGWDKAVVQHWHEKYPYTVFVVQNRALGGFASESLLRTTEQDISAFYPDLIIFHVYGDHRSYEQILRLFRSTTAADVILQTDHGEVLPDPSCTEGLQFNFHREPGCAGFLWVHQRLWHDEMSYHKLPAFAKKYGLALEPQRGWWRDYLLRTHTDPKELLVDEVHPNERGKELIASFFNQYFDRLVDNWNGQTEDDVLNFPVDPYWKTGGQVVTSFKGNRLELVASKPPPVPMTVNVDGSSPKDIDGCYQITRASTVQIVPDWPAVRRIVLKRDHIPEDWTATLTDFSPDQNYFRFCRERVRHRRRTGMETRSMISHRIPDI